VGLVLEGRLTDVKTDIAAGDVMSLEKMLKADSMYEHYTWGWTFAHFLMNDKRHRKKFEKFVKGLVAGKGVKQVGGIGSLKTVKGAEVYRYFRHVMGLKKDEQFEALEEEWHLYVRDTLPGRSAPSASTGRRSKPARPTRSRSTNTGSCSSATARGPRPSSSSARQ